MNVQDLYSQYETEDEFITLEPGTYSVEITGASIKDAKNGGKSIAPIYKITSGPLTGRRFMASTYTLTEAARSIFFRNMRAWGLDKEYFARLPRGTAEQTFEQIKKDLIGRKGEMEVINRDYQGEPRNDHPIGKVKLTSAPATLGGLAAQATPAAAPTPAAPQPTLPPETAPPAADDADAEPAF